MKNTLFTSIYIIELGSSSANIHHEDGMQDGEYAVQTRESDTRSATPSESEKEDNEDDPHVEGDNPVPVECDVGSSCIQMSIYMVFQGMISTAY